MTECEADDKAWEEILNRLKWEKEDEAKEIFLTRCAESAIEAILDFEKEDEKRRAALEELREASPTKTIGAGRNSESDYVMVRGSEWDNFQKKIAELDALKGPNDSER